MHKNNIFKHHFIIYLLSIVLISLTTVLLLSMSQVLDNSYVGLFYLLIIVIIAYADGIKPALVTAILSFLVWNFFFFEPYYTLRITDEKNWILLYIFLVIGIIVGQITGRLKSREKEALEREKETSSLYQASLSLHTHEKDLNQVLESLLAEIMKNTPSIGSAILMIEDTDNYPDHYNIIAAAGNIERLTLKKNNFIIQQIINNKESSTIHLNKLPANIENQLSFNLFNSKTLKNKVKKDEIFIPIYIDDNNYILYIGFVEDNCINNYHYRYIIIIFTIIKTAIRQFKLIEERANSLAVQAGEHLKTVVFSSISHNLKNPLVSLNTTLSSLQQKDIDIENQETLHEYFQLMSEDVKKLTENVEKILNLAQLETNLWKSNCETYDFREIISIALSQFTENEYERIQFEIPDDFLLIYADQAQISQVIRHLTENALQYSPENSTITIGVKMLNIEVIFWVKNHINDFDIDNIDSINNWLENKRSSTMFGKKNKRSGLGLSICKEIVKTHKGKIKAKHISKNEIIIMVTLPLVKS